MDADRPSLAGTGAAAAVTVRSDVGLESIDATRWDALSGGAPLVSHAFLRVLHDTRLRFERHGLDALLSQRLARRHARRGDAALRQDALLRRICVRLGLGRRLSPLRAPLLSEARGGDSFHARTGPAALRRRRRGAHRAPGGGVAAAAAGAPRRRSAVFVAARPVPHRSGGARLRGRRHDRAQRPAVPVGEPRLPRLRRLPLDVQSRQAQEGQAGAPPRRGGRHRRSHARSAARSRQPTGRSSIGATNAPTATIIRRRT